MKKTIYLIFTLMLLFGIFSVLCFAEDSAASADGSYSDSGAENATDSDVTSPSGGGEAANAEENEQTLFSIIYEEAKKYAGQIFSILACIFSGCLMLCYKKGILPLIKGGITALRGGVDALGKEAEKQTEGSLAASQLIGEKLEQAEGFLSTLSQRIEEFGEKLSTLEASDKSTAAFRRVLSAQVDMLYEIFMNASLPQYEKDRIGEMIGEMRASLVSEGDGNEA